ncbi:MAG: hypothetical protein RR397_05070 [Odoribacter sp.]
MGLVLFVAFEYESDYLMVGWGVLHPVEECLLLVADTTYGMELYIFFGLSS